MVGKHQLDKNLKWKKQDFLINKNLTKMIDRNHLHRSSSSEGILQRYSIQGSTIFIARIN